MEKNNIKNEVFEKLIECFTENVKEEEKPSFENEYRNYLEKHYGSFFTEAESEEALENAALMCVQCEKTVNLSKSEAAKTAMLFPDEEYKKLEDISLELASLARDKKEGKEIIIPLTKDGYLESLDTHFANVSELFLMTAKRQYSEALVDLYYIFGESDNLSFRNSVY